jgi:hypothetical protein
LARRADSFAIEASDIVRLRRAAPMYLMNVKARVIGPRLGRRFVSFIMAA